MAFEDEFRRLLVNPIVVYIPAWIAPNFITAVSLVMILASGVLCVVAQSMDPWGCMLARFAAAASIILYAILDCLDGQHARRTKQTSKLGEVLDHCTDAFGVPCCSFAVTWSLNADNYSLFLSAIMALMTYNLQLILYHKSGKFVLAETDGASAQCGGAAIITALAIIQYNFPRDNAMVVYGIWILLAVSTFVMVRNLLNYSYMIGSGFIKGFACFLPCAAVSAVYFAQAESTDFWAGNVVSFVGSGTSAWLSGGAASALVCLISFRSSSVWVFHIMFKRPYSGVDALIMFTTIITVGLHAVTSTMPEVMAPVAVLLPLVPYMQCVVLALATFADGSQLLLDLQKAKQ